MLLFPLSSSGTAFAAEEVPFEVVKTYVTAETTDTIGGADAIVVDGILYSDANVGEKFNYPKKGEFDLRVKVPIEAIKYRLEFWNVGEMGGEKGFIFKSNYGKAKLTRTYELGQAYKNILGDQEFMGMHSLEKKEVGTPSVKTEFTDDLVFSGGPYGTFYYENEKGAKWPIAHLSDGKTITFDNVPEGARKENPHYLMGFPRTQNIHPVVTNSSAFEKWMEILGTKESDCSDPKNPTRDSGIRFNDYSGEVMVRPCNDEDAWYGAELDMVLHKDDHIKTGDDSTCSLALADMTTFVMKPESEIMLSSQSEKRNLVKIVWGKIKANVKRMVKDGSMEMDMSQAVAGIKGTIFVVEETGTESTLKVIEGHVEFTSKATGKSEMISTGEMMTATKQGLGEKKTFDITQEDQDWNKIQEDLQNNTDEKTVSKIKKPAEQKNNSEPMNVYVWILALLVVIGIGYLLLRRKGRSNQ